MTRWIACGVLFVLGALACLVDGRFADGAFAQDGAQLFRWTFAGRVLWEGDRAELVSAFGPTLPRILVACAVALVAGRAFARWFPGRLAAATALGALALFSSIDPGTVRFVAERGVTSAPWYLDLGDLAQGLGLGLVALALIGLLPTSPARDAEVSANPRAARRVVFAACAFAALAPGILSHAVLGGEPLTNDERAYLFQAELFASGEHARDVGDLADFFPARQILPGARAFSKYPPGTSAALAVGELVGLPELLPRLLAGLLPLFAFRIARRLLCPRPERAALLVALSPVVLGVETLWLSHALSLPACLVFAELSLAARERKRPSFPLALGAGVALSLAFLARPLTALAFALPFAPVWLVRPRAALVLCAGLLPGAAFFLWTNAVLTGHPFETAYGLYADTVSPNDRWGLVNLGTAAEQARFNLARLGVWLHGGVGGLWLVVAGALAVRRPRATVYLWAPFVSLFAAYALHRFQGIPWVGPLYLVEAVPLLCVLSACGLDALERERGRAAALLVLLVLSLGSARLLARHLALARTEQALRSAPWRAARAAGLEHGVVFVALESEEELKRFALPPPSFDEGAGAGVVFARDLGARNAVLRARLGDPPAYRFEPRGGTLVPLP